jgi:hypothetical protein
VSRDLHVLRARPVLDTTVEDDMTHDELMAREDAGANIEELSRSKRKRRGRSLSIEYVDPRDWTLDPAEVLAFARAMVEGDAFPTQQDLLYYFSKPWKWTDDRDAWIHAGEPDAFDPSEDA